MLPDIENRVKFLQDVQILSEVDTPNLEVIAGRLKLVAYIAGENIFDEGDEPDNMYFVFQGKVNVTRLDEETGEEIDLAVFDVGDTFGIDALYYKRERSATATALTDVDLYYLNFEDFEWLKDAYPQVDPYLPGT